MDKNYEWSQVVASYNGLLKSTASFRQTASQIEVLRENLFGEHKGAALWVAGQLTEEEQIEIFPWLLEIAISDAAYGGRSRDVILSISTEWIINNIEQYSKPILEAGGDFEYSQLLSLCSRISLDLTHRIAAIALGSDDEDIREAGEYFIDY